MGGHRLRPALQRDAAERGEGHARGDQPARRFSDHHVAVAPLLLEARRDVHGVADDVVLCAADDDFPRVDGDPHPDCTQPRRLLASQGTEGVLHRDGGAHGPERVVLGDLVQSEHRHHAVAEELHHRAALRVDRGAEGLVVALHHAARRLRVEPLVERGRADEVREHDRHDLPRARIGGGSWDGGDA
jgi:hypothetical protein